MSVNKLTLLGNLTADPLIKLFDNGGKIAQFAVATSDKAFKTADGKEIPERTEYHNIIVRNKLAEIAEKYLRKGNKVYLEGTLRYRKYQDAEGKDRWVTEIHCTTFEMLTQRPAANTQPAATETHTETTDGENDDLPF